MSAALKHFHEGRVYPRNNQHRRALFPRRCVSRPVQPLPPPSWDLIVNGNARLRIELQPPLYFLRIASIRNVRFLALSGLSCPRFDVNSSKKEKGKIEFELNWIVEREGSTRVLNRVPRQRIYSRCIARRPSLRNDRRPVQCAVTSSPTLVLFTACDTCFP